MEGDWGDAGGGGQRGVMGGVVSHLAWGVSEKGIRVHTVHDNSIDRSAQRSSGKLFVPGLRKYTQGQKESLQMSQNPKPLAFWASPFQLSPLDKIINQGPPVCTPM